MSALFPVLGGRDGDPKAVQWGRLSNEWALKLHGQSLERLAERGGLSPLEIWWNVHHLPFGSKPLDPMEPHTFAKAIRASVE